MNALEATVEIAKAALSGGTAKQVPLYTITDDGDRANFIKGFKEIYHAIEALVPGTPENKGSGIVGPMSSLKR